MISASRHPPSSAPASTRKAYYFYMASVLIALALSAVLVSIIAQAVEPAARTVFESAPAAVLATAAPRYSVKDIGRAFDFIDANKDGLINRHEAASFRNVAKYFEASDTNKDNALSPAEFSSVTNRP